MISSSDRKPAIKIAGYLEKRSKLTVVSRWKKLWFVLEGRLLLYYKSQLEYLSLSPCRGTVNMGLAASVSPGKANEIIVSTRSHTVSLRALNRSEHDIWLQALIDAMYMPNSTQNTFCCSKPVHHFRYSTGIYEGRENHPSNIDPCADKRTKPQSQQNGVDPNRKRPVAEIRLPTGSIPRSPYLREYRLDKLAKRLSKVAMSDSSIPGRFRLTSTEAPEPTHYSSSLRRSASVENDFLTFTGNIYESIKDSNFDIRERRRSNRKMPGAHLRRSGSECITSTKQSQIFRSEQDLDASQLSINQKILRQLYQYQSDRISRSIQSQFDPKNLNNNINTPQVKRSDIKLVRKLSYNYNNNIKSDTDLSFKKHSFDSGSCGSVWFSKIKEIDIVRGRMEERSGSLELDKTSRRILGLKNRLHCDDQVPGFGSLGQKPTKRAHSFLRRFSRDKNELGGVRKRSLSFLKKVLNIKEKKEEDSQQQPDSLIPQIGDALLEVPLSDLDDFEVDTPEQLKFQRPRPEPPPDYDEVHISSESEVEVVAESRKGPKLPPRGTKARPDSPWHDVPKNNQPVAPPELPLKQGKKKSGSPNKCGFSLDDPSDIGLKFLFEEQAYPTKPDQLNDMLNKIREINDTPLIAIKEKEDEDPDYDVPRPHGHLAAVLRRQSSLSDTLPPTNFFTQFDDSLDPQLHLGCSRGSYEEMTMAPDSLECDPWSSSASTATTSGADDSWATYMTKSPCPRLVYRTAEPYHDSLNPDSLHRSKDDTYLPLRKEIVKMYS